MAIKLVGRNYQTSIRRQSHRSREVMSEDYRRRWLCCTRLLDQIRCRMPALSVSTPVAPRHRPCEGDSAA